MTAVDLDRAPGRLRAGPRHIASQVRRVRLVTALLDLVLLVLAALVALWLPDLPGLEAAAGSTPTSGPLDVAPWMPVVWVPVFWLPVVWLLVLAARGGYSRREFGAGPEEFRTVGTASLVTLGGVGLACFLLELPVSRSFVVLLFALGLPALLVERYVVRQVVHRMRRTGRLMHRVIAVGGASGIREVDDALRRSRHVGYQVIGACAPDGVDVDQRRFSVPVLGRVADTRRLCEEMAADTVLVARGGFATARELRQVAWDLEGSDVELVVVPSLTDVAGPRIHMRPVAGLPLLHVEEPQAGKAGGLTKRLFDLAVALVALLLLSPLLLAVLAVVRIQDGGPVLFRQERVGRLGRPFRMLKVRSMVVDAEDRLDGLRPHNELDGVLFKMRHDPRITRAGRLLRRYSLDELPQLLNVVRGDMSIVGPRPPLPSEVHQYEDDVRRRLLVRPGLTGLWQVSGRSALSWEESVRLDLYYVDNWSMTSDLVIMAKTVRAVLGSSGAY